MHKCLKNEKSANINVFEIMPTHCWKSPVLQLSKTLDVTSDLIVEPAPPPSSASSKASSENNRELSSSHGLEKHKQEILETRNALIPSVGL